MDKSIAILSVTNRLGSAEQLLFKVAKYYNLKGYLVTVYFWNADESEYWEKVVLQK